MSRAMRAKEAAMIITITCTASSCRHKSNRRPRSDTGGIEREGTNQVKKEEKKGDGLNDTDGT